MNPEYLAALTGIVRDLCSTFGAEINDPNELSQRVENLTALRGKISVLRDALDMMSATEVCESDTIKKYIDDGERRLATARATINGEKHTDVKAPVANNKRKISVEDHVDIVPTPAPAPAPAPALTESAWTEVSRRNRTNKSASPDIPVVTKVVAVAHNQRVFSEKLVAPGATIRCMEVGTMSECTNRENLGLLCWARDKQTFCVSINGSVVHLGPSVPTIFDASATLKKVLPHAYHTPGQIVNTNDSTFYIPIKHAQTADKPAIINKALYLPGDGNSEGNRYAYRIGDYDNFARDLQHISRSHLDYAYFEVKASSEFLTLLAVNDHLSRATRK
jgi:hypothetical protein